MCFIDSHAAAAHQLRMMGARKPSYPERFSRWVQVAHGRVAPGVLVTLAAQLRNSSDVSTCRCRGGTSEIVQQPCSRLPTCVYAPPSQQWFSAAHTGLKFSKPAMIFGRKSRGPPAFTACTSWVCLKIKRSGFVPALSRQASLSQRLNHTNFIIYQMGHKNQFFVRNRWNYFLARRH